MSEVNTVSLLNQMRLMAAKAEGSSVEFNAMQEPFGEVLQRALGDVNQLHQSADALKSRYELGDPSVSIGEVMIATQKANLGFEAVLRVRNKLVDVYQDIMNMSI
ncbi:flagellar hook-basal body complex protein FliE [Legionella micdadei]|uniref:Flagellar hook-basal body complex protein FliE n=1 Tax=Legionella micdadei TaxID=451 RepID=A0A098GD80_LEGMI|nr:flagellar hook-basal body complex protein FliE [Legionella micdadei]ARG98904.1 flagellar hook-basal body complex protein FliE [Legionella micdadei]ARH01563.1 flagellar hook-basal body complex protein FliE [Legionella micdadei]KTD28659.1 flagellar hook-basal body complex protein [Legionella micdadei]NSL19314.1 flagellar hook-basal body complex protein FliE [Legionella micdadei]CEG60448.1 Flagellar hook-basal body complex protein fliE [Legionella micdadei]